MSEASKARSAHQNNSERTSKPLEEQCDEFVSLVSVRFQGVKTIDVIERNRPPKNSVALEPGDLEVDFVPFFSMFLGWQKRRFRTCRGAPSDAPTRVQDHFASGKNVEIWRICRGVAESLLSLLFIYFFCGSTGILAWAAFSVETGPEMCADTRMYTPVQRHTNTPAHWYTGTLVHRCKMGESMGIHLAQVCTRGVCKMGVA